MANVRFFVEDDDPHGNPHFKKTLFDRIHRIEASEDTGKFGPIDTPLRNQNPPVAMGLRDCFARLDLLLVRESIYPFITTDECLEVSFERRAISGIMIVFRS